MTETESTDLHPFDQAMQELGRRFPEATRGILFCIHKLQQDQDARLRDFRDEARLHGVPLSGRSFHSARVLLGFEAPSTRRPRAAPEPLQEPEHAEGAGPGEEFAAAGGEEPKRRGMRAHKADRAHKAPGPQIHKRPVLLEDQLIHAVRQLRQVAASDSERLRRAMREAIAVLEAALGE